MYSCVVVLALLLTPVFQSPQEQYRQRFDAAEAQRRAGNVENAETEYGSILADAYYKLGKIYSAQNNHSAAITALEAALTQRPDFPDALVDLSIALFNTAQYKRALVSLDKAIALNPGNAAAYHMRGKSYFMLNDFEKAAVDLQRAVQLSPRDYDVAYTLALTHLKRGKAPLARQIFDRMIAELGNKAQLRIVIGKAYRQAGDLEQAIEQFKQAATIDPQFPQVHYYLGLAILLKDGASRIGEAESELKLEVAAHPDDYFANYYLGLALTIGRKWDAAVASLSKAVNLQPTNPDAYFYLGQSYQELQKYEDAIVVLRRSIALNPDLKHNDYQVTNVHYRLGQCLLKTGKTEEGRKELQIASDLKAQAFKTDEKRAEAFLNADDPNEPSQQTTGNVFAARDPQREELLKADAAFFAKVIALAHENIGLLNAERQKFPIAAEHFSEAARLNPEMLDIYYNLGLAYFKSESYKDAVAAFENALKIKPEDLRAKQLLGLSYFSVENYTNAASLLGELIAIKPNDLSLYYPLALSLGKLGKTAEAQQIVQQMLTYGGDSPQVHIILAKAYYDQDAPAKALDELKAALALDSKVKLAHFYSGLVQIKLGNFAEATREFESELVLNPNDLQTKYHLGYVLLANQETKRGMQLMREVIQSDPGFTNAYFELGKTQLQQGDVKGAIMSLEKAAKLAPEQPHVHYQLGRAYVAAGRQAEGQAQLDLSKQLKEKVRNQPNN